MLKFKVFFGNFLVKKNNNTKIIMKISRNIEIFLNSEIMMTSMLRNHICLKNIVINLGFQVIKVPLEKELSRTQQSIEYEET